jgi:hypothetical protein
MRPFGTKVWGKSIDFQLSRVSVLITLERTTNERTYRCSRYKEDEDEDEICSSSLLFFRFVAFVVFLTLLLLFRERKTTEEDGERTLLRLRRVRGSVLLKTLDIRLMVRTNLRRRGKELVAVKVQQTSI